MWSKLNPGISYVQGMNEILAPIYCLFANDPEESCRGNAEADAFFCFTNLMSEIINNFCKTLDATELGIHGQIKQMNMILKVKDPELWQHLETIQLDPQFYGFRWMSLLLSQEFPPSFVLRLWDTLFSDKKRFRHLLYVGVAMLITKRKELLSYDFAQALKLLQSYDVVDPEELLPLANAISQPDYKLVDVTVEENEQRKTVTTSFTTPVVVESVLSTFNVAWGSLKGGFH
eukprot:TRINITY_DN2199_c0_g1_i15.p1 TRINITY_DN2199_c0_g1~~TRINITY_DN2199_c0_g1_i15.p1  ORF type:complete len:231 (-),score=44.49 TRINITY_DN2199_c0_g1_i15:241-933(-)